jgi:hypothetical protein
MARFADASRAIAVFTVATSVSLSGCAYLFVSPRNAVNVPPERILSAQWLKEDANSGHLTVSRDADFYRRDVCYERIVVDGQDQARLQPGERIDLYLESDMHTIKAKPEGQCSGYGTEIKIGLGAGQWHWYRLDASGLERALLLRAYPTAGLSKQAPAARPTLWQRLRGHPGRT